MRSAATLDARGRRTAPRATTEYNAHLKDRLAQGVKDLPISFDWPSRRGYDSDSDAARGRVGAGGAAIDSIDDMRVLLAGIPLAGVSTTLAIEPASVPLLLLHQLVQEEQGLAVRRCTLLLRRPTPPDAYEARLTDRVIALAAAERMKVELSPSAAFADAPGPSPYPSALPSPVATRQAECLCKLRAWRCQERVDAALTLLRRAAHGDGDILPPMKEALSAGATIGETSTILRELWAAV
ncbi:methylmalonyl-CoA mutase family protein [Streptomyces globisporus]|uniref:methylmalonyl-CoA mutase family protein n=1 Tax=Streptomyces globisporus TaxID=1908 RepID=UPI0004CB3946|nr:methylmalonyl-CoA mutase family protein [Streptomyces globisporus]